MHFVRKTHLFPSSYLFISVYTGHVVVSASLWRNKGRLSDEQGSRSTCPLLVVLDGNLAVSVAVVCTHSSERCKDHAMLKGDIADLDGREELGGHSVCVVEEGEYTDERCCEM